MSEISSVNAVRTFFAKKIGMTRIFNNMSQSCPVTVVKIIPGFVTQIKASATDGYSAVQVGYQVKEKRGMTNPVKGKLNKLGLSSNLTSFKEEILTEDRLHLFKLASEISLDSFKVGDFIDVVGKSKGKGFQGVMKRYNFAGGPAAHGSHFHRRPGSIGNRATPARVFPEKKLPGHMGDERVTVQNLKVVGMDLDKGYLLISGSVPGSKNGIVEVKKARKKA
jgi:large subunit ribosomal protein L3